MSVDPSLVPFGPRKVGPKRQLALPPEILKALDTEIGGSLWVMTNPDKPGTVVVMNEVTVTEVVKKGWTAV
jgi:bifunctional DNA-binding transcriptional regulator/antitoxin component of YhaV-PrlF toxin-antitoxin module